MRGFSDRHLEWQADGPNNFAMNHSSCRSLDSAALEICARRTGKALPPEQHFRIRAAAPESLRRMRRQSANRLRMTPAIALEWLFSVAPWAIRLGALIVVPFRRSPVATQSWLLLFCGSVDRARVLSCNRPSISPPVAPPAGSAAMADHAPVRLQHRSGRSTCRPRPRRSIDCVARQFDWPDAPVTWQCGRIPHRL
jgi:hypothetical protein